MLCWSTYIISLFLIPNNVRNSLDLLRISRFQVYERGQQIPENDGRDTTHIKLHKRGNCEEENKIQDEDDYKLYKKTLEHIDKHGFGAGQFWGGSGSGNFFIRLRLLVKENIILEVFKTDYELSKIRSNTCTPVQVGHILCLLKKRHQTILSSM